MRLDKNCIVRFLFTTIIAFVVNSTFSQTNIRQHSVPSVSPNIRTYMGDGGVRTSKSRSGKSTTASSISKQHKNTPQVKNKTVAMDTVYAKGTVKQHGWFAPKGVISKDIAQHRANSIRFTNRNKRGKWLKMETLDAYGQYASGKIKPYILKNSEDSLANQNWKKKIESACIYEFIPDPTGMNIIQERAYDKDYNIVYTYSRTGIGENSEGRLQFIGSYKDFYGLPAEMRPQEGYSYGTLVKITEDRWGNDSIIEYIDSKGVNKLNADLAAKEYFIYDDNGNLIMQQSRDSIGNLIIDNAGNCGIMFTYDKQGDMKTATFMNEKWEPMSLPNTQESGEKAGIQRMEFKYDNYYREIEMRFVDIEGNPVENVYGCHKIIFEYDDCGNMVRQTCYNINNLPNANSYAGTSTYEFKYDNKGREIAGRFLYANGKPCSTNGFLSRRTKKYGENGEVILDERYIIESEKEKYDYKYEKTHCYVYTQWSDGTFRVDSLDSKGRTTFVGFFGADGKLEMSEGRACEVYIYNDDHKRTTIVETAFDSDGKKVDVNGICRIKTVVDSLKYTKTMYRFSSNDVLKDTYIHRYSPDFEMITGQDDCNGNGILSRSGGTSSVRYLKGDVVYNRKDDDSFSISHLSGVDEFDEPDYISSSSLLYYYQKQFPHSTTKYYDEHNNEITNVDNARDSLPKVMTIEVTDNYAYQLGLKDNDVILVYGDYAVDLDTTVTYLTFKQDWTLRSVIDAKKEKRMVVFRITDPSKKEYGLCEIKGLKGTFSELGFIPHIRYLTDKQVARIKESICKEVGKPESFVSHADFKKTNNEGGSNCILLSYTEMYRADRDKPYAQQIGDPSILLGTCIKDRNLKWTKENGNDTEPIVKILSSRKLNSVKYPRQDYYVTRDGSSMIHMVLDEQIACTNLSDTYISDEDYKQIAQLYNDGCDSINALLKNNKSIKQKSFWGNWKSQKTDTLRYQPEVFLSFFKNGTFDGYIVNYGEIKFTEGTAIYKIIKLAKGEWNTGGDWLFFYPNQDEVILSCIDLLGTDDQELKRRAVSYMNSICEKNKDALLEKMKYNDYISGDIYINSDKKDRLDVLFSSGINLTLVKTKEKQPTTNTKVKKRKNSLTNSKGVEESSPLIGKWKGQIQGLENSNVQYVLHKEGKIEIEASVVYYQELSDTCIADIFIDINISGTWQPTSNGFKMEIEPDNLSVNMDFDIEGVDTGKKDQLISELKKESEHKKTELGMSFLNYFYENEIEVSEVDSEKMVINDNVFTRVSTEESKE